MTTADLPFTVTVKLPAESTQTVVMFLIANKISFTLNSAGNSGQATVPDKKNEQSIPEMAIADIKNVDRQGMVTGDSSDETKLNRTAIEAVFRKCIEENSGQAPPSETEIAKEFGFTLPGFQNVFKTMYGKTFYQIYIVKKMEYAAELLRSGCKASEVSDRIGYGHPIKFNKMFQKHFGITPKRYQMQKTLKISGDFQR